MRYYTLYLCTIYLPTTMHTNIHKNSPKAKHSTYDSIFYYFISPSALFFSSFSMQFEFPHDLPREGVAAFPPTTLTEAGDRRYAKQNFSSASRKNWQGGGGSDIIRCGRVRTARQECVCTKNNDRLFLERFDFPLCFCYFLIYSFGFFITLSVIMLLVLFSSMSVLMTVYYVLFIAF